MATYIDILGCHWAYSFSDVRKVGGPWAGPEIFQSQLKVPLRMAQHMLCMFLILQ